MHGQDEINTVNLTQIPDKIKATYWGAWTSLPFDKQFHFVSRLKLYGDPKAAATINDLKDQFMEQSKPLTKWLAKLPTEETVNHFAVRKPYFEKYPWLFGAEAGAFQCLHAAVHYSQNWRDEYLAALGGASQVTTDAQALLADTQALTTLSSYAVNWLYLANRYFLNDNTDQLPMRLLSLLPETAEGESVILLTYAVTHAIIGESLFYSRPIDPKLASIYQHMLTKIEPIITVNLMSLTLDVLLEFVVACKLVGYATRLTSPIIQVASRHFDEAAGYLVDPQKPDKNDLAGAEHRNVLFLMAIK